jgi:aspartate kinase
VDVLSPRGSRVTSALLAITLREMGHKAVSLLADQIRIISDSSYGLRRIASIEDVKLRDEIKEATSSSCPGSRASTARGNHHPGKGRFGHHAVALAAASRPTCARSTPTWTVFYHH